MAGGQTAAMQGKQANRRVNAPILYPTDDETGLISLAQRSRSNNIGWFKKFMLRLMRITAQTNLDFLHANERTTVPAPKKHTREGFCTQNVINLNIWPANGGHVIEYYCYDPMTDRQYKNLTVVADEKDLAEAISHVLTIQELKR